MATNGFAHEWEHVVSTSMRWGVDLDAEESLVSGMGIEYWPQGAEHISGHTVWYYPGDPESFSQLPFTRGLFPGDYYETCLTGHDQGHKHHTFSLFAPYLIEHYSLDPGEYEQDALYRWIHQLQDPNQNPELPPWPTRNDLKGLALMLAAPAYSQFFPGIQGGDARVRRMFQTYALSAWVNSDHLVGPEGVWAAGASPSETKGYMEDWNGVCLDDVGALPLYNTVTTTVQAQADSITQEDLYPDSPACWSNPIQWRSLQVSTYGYNVLPFVSDPSIRNEGLAYDLRVDISIDDQYWCEASQEMVETELTGNDVLHFFVLGYPTATADLHRAGAGAELVYEYEYSDFDTDPTPTLSFSVGRLGAKYKSVVILMSATEAALEVGPRSARVIPFDYSYWAEGNTSPVTAYTTWPHGDLISDGGRFRERGSVYPGGRETCGLARDDSLLRG